MSPSDYLYQKSQNTHTYIQYHSHVLIGTDMAHEKRSDCLASHFKVRMGSDDPGGISALKSLPSGFQFLSGNASVVQKWRYSSRDICVALIPWTRV